MANKVTINKSDKDAGLRYSWGKEYYNNNILNKTFTPRELYDILNQGVEQTAFTRQEAENIANQYGISMYKKPSMFDNFNTQTNGSIETTKSLLKNNWSNNTNNTNNKEPDLQLGETPFLQGSDRDWYNNVFEKHGYQYQDLLWVLENAYNEGKISGTAAENIFKSYGVESAFTRNELDDKLYGPVKDTTTNNNNGAGAGTGSGANAASDLKAAAAMDKLYQKVLQLEETNNAFKKEIDALKPPTPKSLDELVNHYNIKDYYNMDYLLNMYNDATNKYYQDTINSQSRYNEEALNNTSLVANEALKKYYDSYKYAAPTSMGRGTKGANMLRSLLGGQQTNENTGYELNSILNDYKEAWKKELEYNPTLARNKYNTIGQWLLDQQTKLHTADIKNYINDMTAYQNNYTGIRNAQNTYAQGLADSYRDRANAALTGNNYRATTNNENTLRRVYQLLYGSDWQKAYDYTKHDTAIGAGASSTTN